MLKETEEKIQRAMSKLTQEDKEAIASKIGAECTYYIANYLNKKSQARIEGICDFADYLQESFDGLTQEQRIRKAMNVLGTFFLDDKDKTDIKSFIRRVK